jgi:hypothetical protein
MMLDVCITGYGRDEIGKKKKRRTDASPICRRAPAKSVGEDNQRPGALRRLSVRGSRWVHERILASLKRWSVHERGDLRM